MRIDLIHRLPGKLHRVLCNVTDAKNKRKWTQCVKELSSVEWQRFLGHSEWDHYDDRRQHSTVVSRGWSTLTCEPNPACSLFLYVPQANTGFYIFFTTLFKKKVVTEILSGIKPRILNICPFTETVDRPWLDFNAILSEIKSH